MDNEILDISPETINDEMISGYAEILDENGNSLPQPESTTETASIEIKASGTIDSGMTLYDLNKSLIAKMPMMTQDQLEKKKDEVRKFIRTAHHGVRYYMLLCNELKYYTLFNREGKDDAPLLQDEVFECFQDMGTPQSVVINGDDSVEFWVKNEDGVFMLLFFPYDMGVVLCQ